MGSSAETLCDSDIESVYVNSCTLLPANTMAIYLNSQRLEGASDLFYTPVMVGGLVSLKGMLDSGSMSCTLSGEGEMRLGASGVLPSPQPVPSNVVLIGCGGLSTRPKCIYELEIEVSGSKFLVPTFVIPGQRDEFIIGTNVLKPLLNRMKSEKKYWDIVRVRSFLGMVMYYQHFIPGCSSIAKPLFALTAGQKHIGRHGRKLRRPGTYRELTPGDWTPACVAFEDLKRALMTSVVLAHPNFTKPFILCTDASLDGIGQANYPAHRLEFLALKWAVCDKFSHWLKGHTFTVWTDNNPLTYILTKPKLDACEQRWVSKLAPYTFDIKHVPGAKNVVADALSRDPFVKPVSQRLLSESYLDLLQQASEVDDSCVQDMFRLTCNPQTMSDSILSVGRPLSMSRDDVSAVLDTQEVWEHGAQQRAVSLGDHLTSLGNCGQDTLHTWSADELRARQLQDAAVSRVIFYVGRKLRPSRRERARENNLVLKLLRQWQRFQLRDYILYRVSKDPLTNTKRFQYDVPDSLKADALAGVHDLAGHQGQPRTLSLARQRFFWYDMEKDVRSHVRNCVRCVLSKTPEPATRAPLHQNSCPSGAYLH